MDNSKLRSLAALVCWAAPADSPALVECIVCHASSLRRRLGAVLVRVAACLAVLVVMSGGTCADVAGIPNSGLPIYFNTSDKSNSEATFLTSDSCRACHPGPAAAHIQHGHAAALTPIQGGPPSMAGGRGTPQPPQGFTWNDISFVVGGSSKPARFVDLDGFLLTTGLSGQLTQWNPTLPALGLDAGFTAFEPAAAAPPPYDFERFQYRTTGPAAPDAAQPLFQENRPGMAGTWQEAGVQCEACHGPGSRHVPFPWARTMFVDISGEQTCGRCHTRPFGSQTGEILASDGFIQDQQAWSELRASGGHAGFACTYCHDPHVSVIHDRAKAVRNACTACHTDANMALHQRKVFVRGGYREELTCESCHMPFAVMSGVSAPPSAVGPLARMGDTRTHIFRITTENIDYRGFFTPDGSQVVRDSQGRAAVTADFVCLRCHNEVALPNLAFTAERASEIAIGVHTPPQPE